MDRHVIDEIVVLKDVTDIQISDLIDLPRSSPGDFLSIDVNIASLDLIQTADDIEEGRLTATRRPQQGNHPFFGQFQGGIVDHVDFIFLFSIEIFIYILYSDHDLHLLSMYFHGGFFENRAGKLG